MEPPKSGVDVCELRRIAATVPRGIEMISANRIAQMPSVIVVPIRPAIISDTGAL